MKLVFDDDFRKPYGKVMRWFNLCLAQPEFSVVVGQVKLCGNAQTATAKPKQEAKPKLEAKPKQEAKPKLEAKPKHEEDATEEDWQWEASRVAAAGTFLKE